MAKIRENRLYENYYEDLPKDVQDQLVADFEAYKARAATEPAVRYTLEQMAWSKDISDLNLPELYDYYLGCSGPQMVECEMENIEFYRLIPSTSEMYLETTKKVDLASVAPMPELYWMILQSPITELPFMGPHLQTMYIKGAVKLPTDNIPKHKELTSLTLIDHPVTEFGFLADLPNLKDLTLCGGSLSSLAELPDLPKLEELSLSRNSLSSLEGIERFKKLKSLYVHDNQISSVAPALALSKLENLDISYNPVEDWQKIGEMSTLKSLWLEGLGIEDPSFVTAIPKLNSLDLAHNHLTDLTKLEGLDRCEDLDVRFNKLESLTGLEQLKKLGKIDARSNFVTYLGELPNKMHTLYLDNNLVRDIGKGTPSGPNKGKGLRYLHLNNNQLEDLKGIERFPKLSLLHCNDNGISSLKPLKKLKSFSELKANNNRISSVEPLRHLAELQSLSLKNNAIFDISPLKDLKDIWYIYLDDNPLGTKFRKTNATCPIDAASEPVRELCQKRTAPAEEGPIW